MPPSRPSFAYDAHPSDCFLTKDSSPSSPLCIYRSDFFHVSDDEFSCISSSRLKLKQCKSGLQISLSSQVEGVSTMDNISLWKSPTERMQFSLAEGNAQETVDMKDTRHGQHANSVEGDIEYEEKRDVNASVREHVEENSMQFASEGETEEDCVTPRAQDNETDNSFRQPVCPPAPRKPKATLRFFRRLIQNHNNHHTARSHRLRNPPLPVFFIPDFEAFFCVPQQKASLRA